MLSDMGFMESGNTKQYSSTGSSHSWQDEYLSRSIEQNKNSDNRVVFKQGNSTDTISLILDLTQKMIHCQINSF
jgi:hypothetical protein